MGGCSDDKNAQTLLICLPTSSLSSSYIVIDSHPHLGIVSGENNNTSANGAYICIHSNFDDMISFLQNIFKPVQLAPDIPKMRQ